MALDGGSGAGPERPLPPEDESLAELALAGFTVRAGGTRDNGAPPVPSPGCRRYDVFPIELFEPEVYSEWGAFGLPSYAHEEPSGWARRRVAELRITDGALGEYLEGLPPGPRLARLLAEVDVDDVDDFSLVEVVAAYKRMEAWSAAKAARAAAALAERPALNPTWPGNLPGRTRGECVAGDELAVRLRMSRPSAVRVAACGRAFRGLFQSTGMALEEGLIDWARAQAIVTTLEGLPTDVAMAAQWEVLEKAPNRTLRQVHHDLAKAVIAVDPDHADARHRAARQKRCVHRPRPLPDGMAHMSAILPAADAIALDTALEAAARAAKNAGDSRTLDQLRADSLALMGHTAHVLGHIGPHAGASCACGCDTSDDPGPRTDGDTTAGAQPPGPRPDAGSPPPALPPGTGAPAPAASSGAGSSLRGVPTVADGPPCPGQRLPGGCLSTIRLGSLAGGRADVRVTVPLGVLLPDPRTPLLSPLDRLPEPVAELEGYGPIPPVIARALAAGAEWRRLVTDPTGTQVLDVGRTRYQPTAAIADLVRERDRTCIRPGCSAPARTCDLDHEHEWQDGGGTSAENLGPLCKRDHPVKSIGAFTVAHGSDRTYAWTTPTGHGYLRRPDGTVVTLPRRTALGLRAVAKEAARSGRPVPTAVVDAVLAELAAGTDVGGSWVPAKRPDVPPAWPGVEDAPSWGEDDAPPF